MGKRRLFQMLKIEKTAKKVHSPSMETSKSFKKEQESSKIAPNINKSFIKRVLPEKLKEPLMR